MITHARWQTSTSPSPFNLIAVLHDEDQSEPTQGSVMIALCCG